MFAPLEITITHTILAERVADLLVGAFEGGSDYWMERVVLARPDEAEATERVWEEREELGGSNAFYSAIFTRSGGVRIYTDDGHAYSLTRGALVRGLATLAKDYAHHFQDFVEGSDDATTSDVFLQVCLFDEVRYS